MKRALLSPLMAPGVRRALRPFRGGIGTIFMLHRLTDPETGSVGHDPSELRRTLAFLRRRGYELVELGEMFRRLREAGPTADLGVAFTLDDGYAEQVRVAGPIFAEFDCPATVFVTTGFLDRELWQWWDRVEYAFENCRTHEIATRIASEPLEYRWESTTGPAAAIADFVERCKRVPDAVKHAAIDGLAEAAGIALPTEPPERYAPMTWGELQSWEARGMTFGPHTVTHPILSRATHEQSFEEIRGSWNRLRVMSRRPTPIFCYPNGQRGDAGPREWEVIRATGLEGALVATTGHAEVGEFRSQRENAFVVRRFGYPGDPRLVAQCVSGLHRLRYGTGRPAGGPVRNLDAWQESDRG